MRNACLPLVLLFSFVGCSRNSNRIDGPDPGLTAADPDLVCTAQAEQQAVSISLTGTGFLAVAGDLPAVLIGGATYTASSVDGCNPVAGTLLDVRSCTSLIFELPAGVHTPGWQDLSVQNPAPADCLHAVNAAFYLSPTPRIDRVAPAVPCDRDPEELVITGADFLELDGQGPGVCLRPGCGVVRRHLHGQGRRRNPRVLEPMRTGPMGAVVDPPAASFFLPDPTAVATCRRARRGSGTDRQVHPPRNPASSSGPMRSANGAVVPAF